MYMATSNIEYSNNEANTKRYATGGCEGKGYLMYFLRAPGLWNMVKGQDTGHMCSSLIFFLSHILELTLSVGGIFIANAEDQGAMLQLKTKSLGFLLPSSYN